MKLTLEQKTIVDKVRKEVQNLNKQQDKLYDKLLKELSLKKDTNLEGWLYEYVFTPELDEKEYFTESINKRLWQQ